MGEIWKQIPGYGGHYMASNLGRIKSLYRTVIRKHSSGKIIAFKYRERILSPSTCDEWGHLTVHLGVDGKKYSRAVHRLVLEAFVGSCPAGHEACHGNGIAWDNRLKNLRWDTHLANNADRHAHGNYAVGLAHTQAKHDPEIIGAIISGRFARTEAMQAGVSVTHFYRLRAQSAEWFCSTYGIEAFSEVDRLWAESVALESDEVAA